jgi:molybdopterin/thiamine biosynthesis adenylyltransferase
MPNPLSISTIVPSGTAALPDHRPRIFRPAKASDRDALETLRRELPGGLETHDVFSAQLAALLRSRRPKRPPTAHELDAEIARHAAGRPLAELGVWVHYPWRRCVVHLLDEAEFVELRTSRNRYKITAEEQGLLAERRIGVVGLSVGGQVALTLATERSCGELRLADFDVLELSNLNRLRESVWNLGVKKTTLAARAIAEIDPFLNVICYDDGLTPENLDAFLVDGGRLDVLVEECDGLALKLSCRERARALGIPVVMEANDRATLDIERFDREPARPILHGLLDGLDLQRVSELVTNDEKVPYLMPMVGEATMSDKLRASLLEVGESIETWPQLASDVALGAGVVANVVRRILLGQLNDSGRYFVDLEELVRDRDAAAAHGAESSARPERAALAVASDETPAALLPGQLAPGEDTLKTLLDAAALAPSGGNEQPWRWVRVGAELRLLPQRRFGDSLLNHRDNATFLALGAAAENLVLSAHALGLEVALDPPSRAQQRPLCRFRFFEPGAKVQLETHAWDSLAPFIELRHTNRRRRAKSQLAREVLDELARTVTSLPGCELHFAAHPAAVAEVAEVAARGDRIRMLHEVGHRDLVREIRWTKEEAERERDGIELESLELSAGEHAGLRMLRFARTAELLRTWRRGRSLERLTRNAVLASSAVGLLTAPGDCIDTRFAAGRALERVWLEATRKGLALQPHTASILLFARALGGGAADFDAETLGELLGLQARLRGVFQTSDSELFLFRLFPNSEPLARSLRRPILLGEHVER